jgi:hypothetical protein
MPRTLALLLLLSILITACSSAPTPTTAATALPTRAPNTPSPTITLIPVIPPVISEVTLDRAELPRYESLEITLQTDAQFSNPYDAREVRLQALFTAPDGTTMDVPGFWDGENAWRVRFTPWQEGNWSYALTITDLRAESLPVEGSFTVTSSDLHGWLQVGSWVDPENSPRYLVTHDGMPFYGVGHCDPLNILADGFSVADGVALFDNLLAAGENYVVWWPLYSMSPLISYDNYSMTNMKIIDMVVKDAQKKGVYLVFTVWDHPELRAKGHPWGEGNWSRNGFSELGEIEDFFSGEEMWAWQENFYRYLIARWSYSPAIGMWQTVSEINGTNAYDQTDAWHAKVNQYFIDNDPYRHPTTASKSGDEDWAAGHSVMDAPQVHIYDLEDATEAAQVIADWTQTMNAYGKPNWVGEYGVLGDSSYPEMFHNANWAALGAGAALTPAEWNDHGSWSTMTPEMQADMQRFARFVAEIPLARWNPEPLQINSLDTAVRAWGVAGEPGSVLWVQDASLAGMTAQELRLDTTTRSGVQLELLNLTPGTYSLTPYDTWKGDWLEPFSVVCGEATCTITLPEFWHDMAFKISHE